MVPRARNAVAVLLYTLSQYTFFVRFSTKYSDKFTIHFPFSIGQTGAVLQIGRSLVRSQLVSEFFIDIKSFRSHYGTGVDSASNRNEYQENFLGVKAAGA